MNESLWTKVLATAGMAFAALSFLVTAALPLIGHPRLIPGVIAVFVCLFASGILQLIGFLGLLLERSWHFRVLVGLGVVLAVTFIAFDFPGAGFFYIVPTLGSIAAFVGALASNAWRRRRLIG